MSGLLSSIFEWKAVILKIKNHTFAINTGFADKWQLVKEVL
jgi:hypothetical protein